MKAWLRNIPAVDQLQQDNNFTKILECYPVSEARLTKWLKEVLADFRNRLLVGEVTPVLKEEESLRQYIFEALEARVIQFTQEHALRKVINATGVVIHTNLGRSRLSEAALSQLIETARSYSTLEYHLASGKRGSRHDLVEQYLIDLTGAEAAMVVNNNAAAVYLVLKALAENREVIVSRGELVEIGGSFRISEIMALSDAHLVEVGTTNKTKLDDYEKAIREETSMILKVHKSNFTILGFTEEVATEDLVTLAKQRGLILYEDLGSGTLFDFAQKGIGHEPTVQAQVSKGIDLISFSGDKLLGGPQAGIIVGKKAYIDQLKAHQLARVLRVDKFTLASLEASLKTYLAGKEAELIPTVRDIVQEAEVIKDKAKRFIDGLSASSDSFTCTLREGVSRVGGGTMPDVELATYLVEVSHHSMSSESLARKLRAGRTPVIVRVRQEQVQLDFRTVTEAELDEVIDAFLEW